MLLGLVALTLGILGVRDVRCFAAAFLWMPTTSGVLLGNVSIPLAFALAVAWRYRETVWRPAVAVGLAVSAKLLLWPVFVWMIATRRLRAVALAVVVGTAVTFAAWAAIGFDGLRTYPDLLQRLSEIQAERSYSIVGMAATLGLGSTVGQRPDRRRRAGAARRVRPLRASIRRRSLVRVRRGGDSRDEPDRVAPLPRSDVGADGDSSPSVLGALAAADPPLGESETRVCGRVPDVPAALVAAILVGILLARPRVGKLALEPTT